MRGTTALLAGLLAAAPAMATEDKTTPLFGEDAPLEMTLAGPIGQINRDAPRSKAAHPATLSANGETLTIALSARGQSRRQRDRCRFPPLLIDIEGKAGEASLFHRQNRIKLVTHCSQGSGAEQTLLREYAAYRLYNAITPKSLKVRLVRVTYADGGDTDGPKWGFLIEDADDAARRLGMKEIDVGRSSVSGMNAEDAARYSLFQYMIGNTDFAMFRGSEKGDCCHNSKLLGASKEARADLTPIPYDFDNAGLVDASYAFANPDLGIRSVKTRVYRGFCAYNAELLKQAADFRAKRTAMEAELAAIPDLGSGTRKAMDSYLESFFQSIQDDATVTGRVLKRCRG